jgi:hypothetical protein
MPAAVHKDDTIDDVPTVNTTHREDSRSSFNDDLRDAYPRTTRALHNRLLHLLVLSDSTRACPFF